ncbi:hypothetical protein LXT21_44085 [Myxococcus sp. K38C18041901]|uniref:hypothetical protein n=1 Tax=Myxococcus guangdongensis TaxID=2906760 RepID=UPI0020A7C228|nr:hypothetical protein [Myxococcus guangdongensis]MCP3065769.1 hypothetical protein [Myxococcus guangdongensis]
MRLCAARSASVVDDGERRLTVEVEVKPGVPGGYGPVGWVASMTPHAGVFQVAFLRLDRSGVNRSGHGHGHAEVTRPGIYCAQSQWRATARHRVYFEVQELGERLVPEVLGADIEGREPTTLRALESRFGVSADMADAAEQVLADELEQGRVRVSVAGLDLTVTGLAPVMLRGSPKQVRWARGIRAREVEGFFSRLLVKLGPVLLQSPGRVPEASEGLAGFATVLSGEVLAQEKDASWWINRRPHPPSDAGLELRAVVGAATPARVAALGLNVSPCVELSLAGMDPG